MNLKLLEDRIAVIPITPTTERIGSIHLPDTASRGRVNQGIIRFRGPDADSVRVGDHIIFSPYSGHKLHTESGELILMSEAAVEAIITPDGDDEALLLTRETVHSVLRDMDIDPATFDAALHARSVANFAF